MKFRANNIFLITAIIVLLTGCSETSSQADSSKKEIISVTNAADMSEQSEAASKTGAGAYSDIPVVTFIELGSVNCMPCRMMVPVMDKVEDLYGGQVEVVFYDVWTPEGRPYGQKYGIRAIPTQVFLDSSGREIARHVGFLPFEEVEKILIKAGVK